MNTESEVAQLRRRLVEEYEAGRRGLHEFATGVAQHRFITARMEHMEACHRHLTEIVGDEQALKIVSEVFGAKDE